MEGIGEKKTPKFTVDHFKQAANLRPYQSLLEVGNKDPNFAYRLVENTPEAIRYREQLGYTVVTDGAEDAPGSVGQPDRRRIIAGELVVMRRQKDLDLMHKQALREKARDMQKGPIERFKGKAARMGVTVVDETKVEVSPLAHVMNTGGDDD